MKNHSNTTQKENDSSPDTKLKVMKYCDLIENSDSCHQETQRDTRKVRKAV